MADLSYTVTNNTVRSRSDWAAIWAGVFTFVAIWSVFEMLGIAILGGSSTSSPTGFNAGVAIWTIVLTLIVMYIAGRETTRLTVLADRGDRLVHGIVMFGLSVVAVMVIAALGSGAMGSSLNGYLVNLSPAMRWTAFASLLLGWLGAMTGAVSGGQYRAKPADNVRDIRSAA